jgi:CHASE2 domain-containing sensor protein
MATMYSSSRWRLAMGAVIAVALITLSTSARLFEPWEMRWLDQVLRWRLDWGLTPDVHPRIVHLDLGVDDEKADAQETYDDAAAIIDEAAFCGATVVAFDCVFLRGTERTAKKLQESIAMARAKGCVVVLGEVLGGGLRRSFPFAERYQPAGFIDATESPDGIFRSYQMVYRNGALLEPSFALATYLAWLDVDWPTQITFDSPGQIQWSEGEGAQSASEAPVLLNFRAPWRYSGPKAFSHRTRKELSNMKSDGGKPLRGCLLLVGQTEDGSDLGTTPLDVRQPKILLHSTALNDLMQEASLRRLPWYTDGLLLLVAMVLAALTLRSVRSPRIVAVIWIAGCALLLSLGFITIVKTNRVPGTVLASVGWSTMCGLAGTQRLVPAARRLARLTASHPQFEVFISAAHPDYDLAEKVHGYLEGSRITAFFCARSLLQVGNSSFSKVIDTALEQARHMVVIATDAQHLRRNWVESEWRFFHDELRAGRKRGNLVLLTNGTILPEELPSSLRGYEMISDAEGLEPLLAYVHPSGAAGSVMPSGSPSQNASSAASHR